VGGYELSAGTIIFPEAHESPDCGQQSTAVMVEPEDFNFNTGDDLSFVVKDGVLNVRMFYLDGGPNNCADPQSLATINLQYDFFDCGAN
jgi:hypothetical protein